VLFLKSFLPRRLLDECAGCEGTRRGGFKVEAFELADVIIGGLFAVIT